MTVRHLLPVVLVGEAPPRSGLGPLGPFDCDSGLRLARLDPANPDTAAFSNVKRLTSGTARDALARTLTLFERINLLAEHPGRAGRGDAWPKDQAAGAWRALAPRLAGRRVALVGRAAEAAGLKGLPPLVWARLGDGEPAEVCRLPSLNGVNRWQTSFRTAVGAWLAQVRKEREDADNAWVAIGGGWAYHLARGEWGRASSAFVPIGPDVASPNNVTAIRDRLLAAACGIRRFGGFGALTLLDHALLVADLCAAPGAKRLALAHDLHEAPLVGDMSSPLKRLCRREWRPVERVAQAAVERLLGLDPTPAEREEVRQADRLALLVEARQVGVDLGDPRAEFGRAPATIAHDSVDQLAQTHATPADWLSAWTNAR